MHKSGHYSDARFARDCANNYIQSKQRMIRLLLLNLSKVLHHHRGRQFNQRLRVSPILSRDAQNDGDRAPLSHLPPPTQVTTLETRTLTVLAAHQKGSSLCRLVTWSGVENSSFWASRPFSRLTAGSWPSAGSRRSSPKSKSTILTMVEKEIPRILKRRNLNGGLLE
jgi:hypothetical protein